MIRYLVNSLQAHENSYEDALDPLRKDATKSFMGEHELVKMATVGDIRTMGTALMNAIQASHTPATTQVTPGAIMMVSGASGTASWQHQQIPLSDSNGRFIGQHAQPRPDDTHCEQEPLLPAHQWVYIIPDLGCAGWKEAVKQWHHGDPSIRLQALKAWPDHKWQGRDKKALGTKRRIRELIALEYKR